MPDFCLSCYYYYVIIIIIINLIIIIIICILLSIFYIVWMSLRFKACMLGIQQTAFWSSFLLFPENKALTFYAVCLKCQSLFSGKNKKPVISYLCTEFAQRVIKGNENGRLQNQAKAVRFRRTPLPTHLQRPTPKWHLLLTVPMRYFCKLQFLFILAFLFSVLFCDVISCHANVIQILSSAEFRVCDLSWVFSLIT